MERALARAASRRWKTLPMSSSRNQMLPSTRKTTMRPLIWKATVSPSEGYSARAASGGAVRLAGMGGPSGSADPEERGAFLDAVAGGDVDGGDGAGGGGVDVGAHLHGLDGGDLGAGGDGVADLDVDGDDLAGERAGDVAGAGRGGGRGRGGRGGGGRGDDGRQRRDGRRLHARGGGGGAVVEDFDEHFVGFAFNGNAEFFHGGRGVGW